MRAVVYANPDHGQSPIADGWAKLPAEIRSMTDEDYDVKLDSRLPAGLVLVVIADGLGEPAAT